MIKYDLARQLILLPDGCDSYIKIPGKPVVCRRCGGTGKHVNPNIDGNGISPEEFYEDLDFQESYFSGIYDVTCHDCKGQRVILEPVDPKNPDWVEHIEYLDELANNVRLRERGIEY